MHNPAASGFVIGVVVPVLGVTTPTLFLGGLAGLYSWLGGGGEGSPLTRTALVVGLIGTVLGVFDQLDWWESDRWVLLYPALTAAGAGILVGLYFWLGGGGSPMAKTGLVVGLVGTVLGIFDGLDWWELEWWVLLFAALTVGGVGMVVEGASRPLGALVLASGALGWGSLLTDPAFSGVLVPIQPVHVVLAALFCLSWVAWGWVVFRGDSERA